MSDPSTVTEASFAIFRCDASLEIGGGHVMRCLALANALSEAGWRCGFAVRTGTLETVPALGRSRHEIRIVTDDAATEPGTLREYWPDGADWLVIDHYERDASFETACRPWARAVLAIDDLADRRHDCDLLLDQNLGRLGADYAGLVPENCRLLLGPQYALLRPEFAELRESALARRRRARGLRRILISLGASDPHDLTTVVLDGIELSKSKAAIDVVAGAASPNARGLASKMALMGRRPALHTDTDGMAELMARADLAVGGGGSTSWERCCVGLPAFVVILADNQREIARALEVAGAVEVLGPRSDFTAQRLAGHLNSLIARPDALADMARQAAGICSGHGTRETIAAIGG